MVSTRDALRYGLSFAPFAIVMLIAGLILGRGGQELLNFVLGQTTSPLLIVWLKILVMLAAGMILSFASLFGALHKVLNDPVQQDAYQY